MAKKQIILAVGGVDFTFEVGLTDYNNYINEIKPDDKVAPSARFLRRTLADKGQLEPLNELCNQGLTVELAGAVIGEFRPQVEIEVKK